MTDGPTGQSATLRARAESALEAWACFVARHPRRWIAVVAVLTAGLASQIPNIHIETSSESMFNRGDPTLAVYDEFRERFGREDLVLVGIETPDVFRFETLERLGELHRAIEAEVPHLVEVLSLVNVRATRAEGDELVVDEFLTDWPETEGELETLRERALANPLYRDLFIDAQARITTLTLRMDAWSSLQGEADALAGFDEDASDGAPLPITGAEASELVAHLDQVTARFDRADFRITTAGGPIVATRMANEMVANLGLFVGLALATITATLALLFRRLSGVLLPQLVVGLSIVSTFGIQGWRGTPASVTAQIVPSFLLAVGVGAAVHLLVVFYQRFDDGDAAPDAIAFALGHSGLAVVMAAVTTAGGLFSFAVADMAPIVDLGILAPVGIALGLVYSLVLLPALLVVLPIRRKAGRPARTGGGVAAALVALGDFGARHPWPVVAATAALCGLALVGSLRLGFQHDAKLWFPEDHPVRVDTQWIDDHLAGAMVLEILVDSGRPDGMKQPALLQALERVDERVRAFEGHAGLRVTKTTSLANVVREIHQALNGDRPDARRVPDDSALVAQELLLFENSGSDDLGDFVDSQFATGRMTMRLPDTAPNVFHGFIPQVETLVREELGPGVEIQSTGYMVLLAASFDAVARSMLRSYTLAVLIITPLMMFLIGNLRGGLMSMVPNLSPILLVLGLMGWTGIDIDMFTLLIGSIAIGVAVDDTIHFMHNFYRYYERSGDAREAVRSTLETTGQAMFVTSVVLSLGFLIYGFAELQNLVQFGMLTSLVIALAFLADLIVSPALVTLATRHRPHRPR